MNQDTKSISQPDKIVRQHTMDRIEFFLKGRHLDIFQGLRSSSMQISESYRSRVVVELIQNAHDAHSPCDAANGSIALVLNEDEGSHGHLYVANAGLGFTIENFTKLCGVGTSTKHINEGIGYKGIGFLSVFQVCSHPEIYSMICYADERDDFDGFRFRIPDDTQLREELVTLGVEQHSTAIINEIPRILLPVPITCTPDKCKAFATEGYATVVRLPLKSDEACVAVRNQIKDLSSIQMPHNLFLNRIARVSVSIRGSNGELKRCLRREPRFNFHQEGLNFSEIELFNESKFLVVAMTVPRSEFISIIEEDVNTERVASDWSNWQGDAELSVAVPIDGSSIEGRLYNFLPMSDEAISPFAGHLNAPFHTRIDRKSLTENVHFNNYLLDKSAVLCVRIAEVLRDGEYQYAKFAVPDLLCWRNKYRNCMHQLLSMRYAALASSRFAPVLGIYGRGVVWQTFGEACIWLDECELLSPPRIAREAGVAILTPVLGDERIKRIMAFCEPDVELMPDLNEVADWVEVVASKLLVRHKNRSRFPEWNSFYRALERIFRDSPDLLFNHPILLTANNRLVSAERREERTQRRKKGIRSAIFFPPVRGPEHLFKKQLPKAVQRRINFLHPKLECSRERSQHAEIRSFLEHSQLVRRHDVREFLRVLAGAMNDSSRIRNVDSFLWSALQVALCMVDPMDVGSWLAGLQFKVPTTRGGWIPADSAYLGREWSKSTSQCNSSGSDLEELIALGNRESQEIAALEDALILPLSKWRVNSQSFDHCLQFLVACGAIDHFRPKRADPLRRAPKVDGRALAEELLRRSDLNERNQNIWRRDLASAGSALPNPYTPYSPENPMWRLLAQDEYRTLSNDVRKLYAYQVINLLNTLGDKIITFQVHRPDHSWGPNRTKWWTPLASFLRHEKWVPVSQIDGSTAFLKTSDAWVYESDANRRPPEFLEFATPEFRQRLDDCIDATNILKNQFSLKSLNSTSSAIPLVHLLGTVVKDKRVHQDELATFGKLYERTWKKALDAVNSDVDPPNPSYIAAVVTGRLIAIPTSNDVDGLESNDDEFDQLSFSALEVWLDDSSSPLSGHMLAEAGKPVFPFRLDREEKVAGWLEKLFPSLVKRVSKTDIVIHVDGKQFTPSSDSTTLVDEFGAWVPEFVAVAADLCARFARLVPEQLAVKVRQIRVKRVDRILVKIGDDIAPLPKFARGCLFFNDVDLPTIIYENQMNEQGFKLLSRLAMSIDEALGGRSQLGTALSAGCLELAQLHQVESAPSVENYAMIFKQPDTRVQHVLALVRSDLDRIVYWLQPLVWMGGGGNAVNKFNKAVASEQTESSIHSVLETLRLKASKPANELIAACKNTITGVDLVRKLNLDLARYNEAMDNLGSKYTSLNFSTEHADTFRRFLADRQRQISESLRVHFSDQFDDIDKDLSKYVAIRNNIPNPDTTWGTKYFVLQKEAMEERLISHLSEAGVTLVEQNEWLEPQFAEVRERNLKLLQGIVEQAVPIVRAWHRKESQTILDVWSKSDVVQALTEIAHNSGWLDFQPLGIDDLLRRLQASGAWPESMPLTISLEHLQLSDADLQAEENRVREQREQKAREQRTVVVNGYEIVEDETPGYKVAELVKNYFAKNETIRKNNLTTTQLNQVAGIKNVGGDRAGGGITGGATRNLSREKRSLIGFFGELIAFEWLKLQFKSEMLTEECWVSRYRERIYSGEGDDSKGYDFVVYQGKVEWHFEVKATSGSDRLIKMGVTEIADAERCKADRQRRYRILFIENALEPQAATVHMLPNPRSKKGETCYREMSGTGVKLSFDFKGE